MISPWGWHYASGTAFYKMKCSFIIIFFFIIIIFFFFFVIFITINYGLQMLVNIFVKTNVPKVIFLSYHYKYIQLQFHLNWLNLERIRYACTLCIIATSQNLLKSLIDILLCVSGCLLNLKWWIIHACIRTHLKLLCIFWEVSGVNYFLPNRLFPSL